MDMYNVMDIVRFFLSRGAMTPKKLQKLLYYAYAWTLALLNDAVDDIQFRLFNEPIEAWVHGPVVPEVYSEFKGYGWNDIPMVSEMDENIFASDVLDVLNQVWDVYGSFTGNELEEISHKDAPWREARNGLASYMGSNRKISDKSMFEYYNEQASN